MMSMRTIIGDLWYRQVNIKVLYSSDRIKCNKKVIFEIILKIVKKSVNGHAVKKKIAFRKKSFLFDSVKSEIVRCLEVKLIEIKSKLAGHVLPLPFMTREIRRNAILYFFLSIS